MFCTDKTKNKNKKNTKKNTKKKKRKAQEWHHRGLFDLVPNLKVQRLANHLPSSRYLVGQGTADTQDKSCRRSLPNLDVRCMSCG
mgnify:CR=1 FL=1